MNAPTEAPPVGPTGPVSREPNVGGVRVRPALPLLLYALLVASAALALYAQRADGIDPVLGRTAPWVFLAFSVGFAAYRLSLVMARRYSPFKAFFQIFLAALFFMLLLVPGARVPAAPGLLGHREAAVRVLAARVAGLEHDRKLMPALLPLLEDPVTEVRVAAREALVRLNGGVDLGPSQAAWKAAVRP